VRIDRGTTREYTAGTRIGGRYWPDGERSAVDTVREPPLVALVTFAAVGLVIADFALSGRISARRSRPTSR